MPIGLFQFVKRLLKRSKFAVAVVAALRAGFRDLREVRWKAARNARIRRYSSPVRKLHLGAGSNSLPGWLNTDSEIQNSETIFVDLTQPLPFPDASFDYIYGEHLIEHFTLSEGRFVLAECFRCLKRGGRIRLVTPNLASLAALYSEPQVPIRTDYLTRMKEMCGLESADPASAINSTFYNWGHRFIYDRQSLCSALATAGFTEISEMEIGQSPDGNLRGIDSHAVRIGSLEIERFESMVFEAVRPRL